MRNSRVLFLGLLVVLVGLGTDAATHAVPAAGNADAGARDFRACVACHSLEAGRSLTGPSLAGIWGRKAGTIESFPRYSDALKSAGLAWDEKTLDQWLANPKALVPGNYMVFPGVRDPQARSNIIAFLKAASEGKINPRTAGSAGAQELELENLKTIGSDHQIASINYCRDTYRVTTVAGTTTPFWEFNLRFKTDSSDKGPPKGKPALLRASMGADRAFVIFSSPSEITSFIKERC